MLDVSYEKQPKCICLLDIIPIRIDPECKWHGNSIIQEQQKPKTSNRPAIWDLVVKDMQDRNIQGTQKYGTPLQAFNGRNSLWDAYQEALDLCVYLRQKIEEEKE